MKNEENWKPTKYVYRNGHLHTSLDASEVAVFSRLTADITASFYEKYAPHYCHGRLADIGCGKAPLYGLYKKHVTDVLCVDWSLSEHGNEYVDIECDLTKTLPLENDSFDTLLVSDVLEHLPEPTCFLKEMYRIQAPGGHILLNIPFLYGLHETPHDYYRYTEYALRYMAEKAGYQVLVLESIGGNWAVLAGLMSRSIIKTKLIGRTIAKVIQYFSLLFSKRSTFQFNRHLFPLGYFMVCIKSGSQDTKNAGD